MKKLIFLFAVLVALNCAAQTPDSIFSALGSKAALQSFCLEQSVTATIGVDGDDNIVSVQGFDRYVTVSATDGLELTKVVSATKIGFGFVDGVGNNTVWKNCTFWDSGWNVMFQGWARGEVLPAKGGYQLVWDGDVVMALPDWINIGLPDGMVDGYGYIRYTDSDGNVQWMWIGYGNELWLPTEMVGTDAVLIIRGWDENGQEIGQVLDLSTGEFLPIETLIEYGNPISIEGVVSLTDSLVWVVGPGEEDVLFQLTVTEKSTVPVKIQTMDGSSPLGFYIRTIGDQGWGEWVYVDGSTESLDLEGLYHFRAEWPTKPLPPLPPLPPLLPEKG